MEILHLSHYPNALEYTSYTWVQYSITDGTATYLSV